MTHDHHGQGSVQLTGEAVEEVSIAADDIGIDVSAVKDGAGLFVWEGAAVFDESEGETNYTNGAFRRPNAAEIAAIAKGERPWPSRKDEDDDESETDGEEASENEDEDE